MSAIRIVNHGRETIICPPAGRWAMFFLRPGRIAIGEDHWEALLASDKPEADKLRQLVADGVIGPLETTPGPQPEPAPEPEEKKAKAKKAPAKKAKK